MVQENKEQVERTMKSLSTAVMGRYVDKLAMELYKFLDYQPPLILFCQISLMELTIHFGNIVIIYASHQNDASHGAQGSMEDFTKYITGCQCQIPH